MGKNYRQGRLSEEIKKIISELLINGVKDPRLSSRIITISAVEVTSDGSYATCFVTPLILDNENGDEVRKQVLDGLNRTKGMFKRQIARDVKLRHVPELIFKMDTSMDYGRHIDKIIEDINLDEDNNDKK